MGALFVNRDAGGPATGAVVVVDVLRAFTTAAYAFAAGAREIILVADVAEALRLKRANPRWLAMGEYGGRRIDGFDLPNSPVQAAQADLGGRTIVQRTSAGTRGVVATVNAQRLWCTGLVCASATARAVSEAGLGGPTYVITGDWPGRPDLSGLDDRATADFIESVRTGAPLDPRDAARAVVNSEEAARTLALGAGHVDPADVQYAVDVDRFDFAMEATREARGLVLRRT